MKTLRGFGSDNNAGVHPEIMAAIVKANIGHVPGYGEDDYTREAIAVFRRCFGEETEVFFVFGGTGANTLSLRAAAQPHHAVICAKTAHINVDECGAPEKFSGCKLLDFAAPDGKLTVELIRPALHGVGDIHQVQPRVISISQPTELGTLYTIEEIEEIAAFAHHNHMILHMDGARICNAAAALDAPLRAITRDAGVDILSFGGAKNGLMYGEAVVIFDRHLAQDFEFIRKQGAQLASKMRFIAVQFTALLSGDLWLRNARNANRMASLLAERVSALPGMQLTQPVQANAVFASIPPKVIPALLQEYFFYPTENPGEVRWMASYDTKEEDIERFVETLARLLDQELAKGPAR
ncbi:MAG: low specificity L-threonine aldolase [Anaerolineae bacterium]|nr:low specificity L-threonine aldolase [Anaerolineae bacterium]